MLWLGFRRGLACRASLVLVVVLAAGCSKEEMPKTYIVQGKVIRKDGQPYKGGAIMFRSLSNRELQAYAEIFEDGTFKLHTLGHTKQGHARKLEGTIEGEFQVSIEPPGGRPAWLKKTYHIEAKQKNDITVVADDFVPQ